MNYCAIGLIRVWNINSLDDVPKNVVGDSARVMQVFTNLIGNSIKFTPDGRISVRARLVASEDISGNSSRSRRRSFSSFSLDMFNDHIPTSDEVVILFEVDDTGPGIEPGKRYLLPPSHQTNSVALSWKWRLFFTNNRSFDLVDNTVDVALRERVFENFVQGDASTTRT